MTQSITRRTWTVAEAKAHLSEVLRRAEQEGPQQIGVRKPFVVVPAELWHSSTHAAKPLGRGLVDNMPRGAKLDAPDRREPGRETTVQRRRRPSERSDPHSRSDRHPPRHPRRLRADQGCARLARGRVPDTALGLVGVEHRLARAGFRCTAATGGPPSRCPANCLGGDWWPNMRTASCRWSAARRSQRRSFAPLRTSIRARDAPGRRVDRRNRQGSRLGRSDTKCDGLRRIGRRRDQSMGGARRGGRGRSHRPGRTAAAHGRHGQVSHRCVLFIIADDWSPIAHCYANDVTHAIGDAACGPCRGRGRRSKSTGRS